MTLTACLINCFLEFLGSYFLSFFKLVVSVRSVNFCNAQYCSFSKTYEQVEGVNEADIIKTDGKYIYCVDGGYSWKSKVVIFSAKGKDSRKVAEIDVFHETDAASRDEVKEWDYYYAKSRHITDMYLNDDRLIVVCGDYANHSGYTVDMSHVRVYDISDIENISLVDTFTQSGVYVSGRMIGDMLYLVSSFVSRDGEDIPACGKNADPAPIPADCIYATMDADTPGFLVISAYDTSDRDSRTVTKSILGRIDDIYCNLDHLYIYSTVYGDSWYNGGFPWGGIDEIDVSTQIIKVDLSDDIAFSAYTEVNGMVDDQYAFDEYQGNLRVATTVPGELYVLNDELSVIGSVTGFARNESIKAVRYVGDTAYVITYKQTDPLFVIDLSVPTNPMILGEAKISGFSTMLVPIDDNTILGLGYHTSDSTFSDMEVQDGFKLVLFDVSDKLDPRVLDTMVYEECSSEVQYNPKALVYNPDRDDYIVPLNYYHWGEYDSERGEYQYEDEWYGGALNFRIRDNQLVEVERYKVDHDAVERCVYIGDTVYMTYRDQNGALQIESAAYK